MAEPQRGRVLLRNTGHRPIGVKRAKSGLVFELAEFGVVELKTYGDTIFIGFNPDTRMVMVDLGDGK